MNKPPTLKEESDRRFKAFLRTKKDRWTYGAKPKVDWGPMVNPYDWLINAGCNLIHAKDLALALLNLRVPFTVCRVKKEERYHECVIAMHRPSGVDDFVRAHASGYGLQDALYFSRHCPTRLKFRLCRELALQYTHLMRDHYEYQLEHWAHKKDATSRRVQANERHYVEVLTQFQKTVDEQVRTYEDLTRAAATINQREARLWTLARKKQGGAA